MISVIYGRYNNIVIGGMLGWTAKTEQNGLPIR